MKGNLSIKSLSISSRIFGEKSLLNSYDTINDDISDRVEARTGNSKNIFGKDRITEVLLGLKFDISLSSFFQQPKSAEKLYAEVLASALENNLGGKNEVVLDLFAELEL